MPAGRPFGLTPEIQKEICAMIRMGAYAETAFSCAGVSRSMFYRWMKLGLQEKDGTFANFRREVKRAMAQSEMSDLQAINDAIRGVEYTKTKVRSLPDGTRETTVEKSLRKSWQAAAWRLERKMPDKYARRQPEPRPPKKTHHAETMAIVMAMEGTMRGVPPPPGLLPEAWTTFRWTATQLKLLDCRKRFIGLPCGRGSGKSEIAKRRLVIKLAESKDHQTRYFFAAPTNLQAMRIGWDAFRALIPPQWLKQEHKADQYFETIFGSRLYVLGLDKPFRAEGTQWDGCVIDESCDQRPGVFDRNILPALTHYDAFCWRIGVPKRTGTSSNEYRKWCEEAQQADIPDRAVFWWPSSDVLTEDALAYAKAYLDPKDYREQFEAHWETVGGGIFWAFEEGPGCNVRPCDYDPQKAIVVGCDFNMDPMCWVLGHRSADGMEWFDELWLRNCHTQKALDTLHARYPLHDAGWEFYCDAAGNQRHTSGTSTAAGSVLTDLVIIMNDTRFRAPDNRPVILFPGRNMLTGKIEGNPPVASRFAACNAMFLNAAGERRMHVSPRCAKLVEDLRSRHYEEGTNDPDDGKDQGHITDAMGYAVWKLFPIRPERIVHKAEVIIKRGPY